MPNTSTVTDRFNGAALTAPWSSSYGNVGVAGGRAFVECGPGFPAIKLADAYTLDVFSVQVFSATLGGATTEATTGVWVQSPSVPGGTDVGFVFDAVGAFLSFRSRTGYFDGGAVTVAHVAGSGIWIRLRIAGGNLLWDTSADGLTWTNARTAVAPAWVLAATDVRVLFEAHRNDGTVTFAEFDDFNLPPAVTHNTTTTLSGTGALTSAAARTAVAAATLAGVGALTGAAARTAVAAVTLAGVGALTGTTARTAEATATLAGLGGLTGTTTRTAQATATLAGTGTLIPAAARTAEATATLAGMTVLAGVAGRTAVATVTLAGVGGLTGVAGVTVDRPPILSGAASVRALSGVATVRALSGTARVR